MKRYSFTLLQTHLLSVLSLLLSLNQLHSYYSFVGIMFFEDNVHSYSYKDIMVSTNVLFVIYVIGLHVFLQISVEYAKCVKY